MKKIHAVAGLLVAATIGVGAFSQAAVTDVKSQAAPTTGVKGSLHDMNFYITNYRGSEGGNVDSQGRICAYCHTPHHAITDASADYMPLWSHEYTKDLNWTSYQSATLTDATTAADPLMGPSRLCMSCHDGVVAVDQHYGQQGTIVGLYGDDWGGRDVGKNGDLTGDHPVGFSYKTAQANDINNGKPGLAPANTGFIGNETVKIENVLYAGEIMTCATCHDVHNKDNVANTKETSRNYFVYADQNDSKLCRTCHLK
jgi:NAD-dependent dihydropyrimidine dehydrogenase PreA subunit